LKSFFVSVLFIGTQYAVAKSLIFPTSSKQAAKPAVESNAAGQSGTFVQASSAAPAVIANSGGTSNNINSELFFMMEQLKQEVMALRGLVEEQGFQIRQMQKRSRERYEDVDARIQSLAKSQSSQSAQPSAPSVSTSVQPPVQVSSGENSALGGEIVPVQASPSVSQAQPAKEESDEKKVEYKKAYQFVQDNNFPAAIDAFHAFVDKYPDGDLTGNAFYWLGEVYLATPKLEQARQAFTIVVKTFPGHRKLADAMYKLGVTYDRMQKPEEAERYLKRVQQEFPNSTASKLAVSYTISR